MHVFIPLVDGKGSQMMKTDIIPSNPNDTFVHTISGTGVFLAVILSWSSHVLFTLTTLVR